MRRYLLLNASLVTVLSISPAAQTSTWRLTADASLPITVDKRGVRPGGSEPLEWSALEAVIYWPPPAFFGRVRLSELSHPPANDWVFVMMPLHCERADNAYFFEPLGIAIFETVMASPFILPVSITVWPACAARSALSWFAIW